MILALEDKILSKYGLTLEDFNDSDNRILFDDNRDSDDFKRVLNLYFTEVNQPKIIEDIIMREKKAMKLIKICKKIDKLVDFDFMGKNYLDFIEFLESKDPSVKAKDPINVYLIKGTTHYALVTAEKSEESYRVFSNNSSLVNDWIVNHLDLSKNWRISDLNKVQGVHHDSAN